MGGEFGADPPGEAGTDLCGLGDGRPLGFLPGPVSLSEAAGRGGEFGVSGCGRAGPGCGGCAVRGAKLGGALLGINFWSGAIHSVESSCTGWPITRAFLILPWMRVPHLASHVLGAVARRISADWQWKYGHELDWLETFVEHERFAGSCYRAANWQCVGQTAGRSRQDRDHTQRVPIKDVYLYRLGGRGL